jgi:hypothetical protein
MSKSLTDNKRAFLIGALGLTENQGAAMSISDLEHAYYANPPANGGGTGTVSSVNGVAPVNGNVVLNADNISGISTDVQVALDSKVGDDGNGRLFYSSLPEGVPFSIYWNGTGWEDASGDIITARPAVSVLNPMHSYGGAAQPSFAVAGDIWFPQGP